ncbi:MAG: Gfo/Idh/MocA family oxidoreductase [Candidatus Pseudobacter hemicellulosilyticus]|uniref:Gfo/Idh/MocA family oxidoreductase n=1 Tax=Candidatus Pseudobacter hemicellulosilyticus TaxID=3121375 RepID=A0AAJ5WT29_9BACT|nr:MAG: Gfo/Idh/MocA family oxidoreductase [Pseudobacter sp.]
MAPSTQRRRFLKQAALLGIGAGFGQSLLGQTPVKDYAGAPAGKRIGVIGLDTEHGPAFARLLNPANAAPELGGYKVVAACKHGSYDIPSSLNMIPGNTKAIEEQGVKIVDSIAELLPLVDLVMLETNDGRLHLQQALEVFKAGKTVFIDKPIAASLADTLTIYRAAEKYKVPVFSSSTLRYIETVQQAATGAIGEIAGVDVFAPASIERTHPDLFWYGIHGVEMLFTILGARCTSVQRVYTDSSDLITGIWDGNRIGSMRGVRTGNWDFGGRAYGKTGKALTLGNFTGYAPLVPNIIRFFETGVSPVPKEETIGIVAFMEAAEESKKQQGKAVRIDSVMKRAQKKSMTIKI